MKHFLRIILGWICISCLLAGCADNAAIEELKNQLEELKSVQIASIGAQISNIQKSIEDLEGVDKELSALIASLQKELDEQSADLTSLISTSQALSTRIEELKSYCDQQDNGVKSWAEVTFATLEQHSAVLTEIASIKNSLAALSQAITDLDTTLSGKIADAESSIKSWVNEQLTGYYTIAQTEAKLKALENGYTAGDQALSAEIETLRQNLNQAKADLTTAYQTAITTAITENNGTINQKIAADIKTASDALQAQIDTLSGRLDAVESRLSALEANLAKIIGMVQSVVVVPYYSDGSVKMTSGKENLIRFEVYPLDAAQKLAEAGVSALSLDCVETETKAGIFTNIPISAVSFDGEIFTVTADGSGLTDNSIFTSTNARLRISDGTVTRSSEYFPLAFGLMPVDLGLGVLWGTCNLGASLPERYGDYYAWGETEPYYESQVPLKWKEGKTGYDGDSYKWIDGYKVTKYCPVHSVEYWGGTGSPDGKTILEAEDDPARKLGGKWRMPTQDEWDMLLAQCSWTWTTHKDISGYIVSASNGGSIFLPAAGYRGGTSLYYVGSSGYYWSSSLDLDSPFGDSGLCAEDMRFSSTSFYHNDYERRLLGLPVRPVYGDYILAQSIEFNKTKETLMVGEGTSFSVDILPTNASIKTVCWSSSDESIAYVDENGNVTALSVGVATIMAKAMDGGGVYTTCQVTVIPFAFMAVDLGLLVKWANANLGATKPEEYGNYYAWGEVEPKSSYDKSSYKWTDGYYELTKYNSSLGLGPVDNKTQLDPEDDAAHVALGGNWRIPTDAEWTELMENCTWTWTSDYIGTGVAGVIVASNVEGYTDKSIFLPAAGDWIDTNQPSGGYGGYYWSSSRETNLRAYYVYFVSSDVKRNNANRYIGLSVRPVSD